ncbi:MAG: HAMP domain-containing histidine kinase [Ktedonobacteraceae bacterium]|nr:HAMP domain-containing histidine kinase [Ktedonobacteraceae bacterium]
MFMPLQLRFTLFYTFLLGLALLFFGQAVYGQAQQRAYQDLDNTLKSRAESVRFGKLLLCPGAFPNSAPYTLPSVDGLGTGGVAIEVLDSRLNLLATTSVPLPDGTSVVPDYLANSPTPWDQAAIQSAFKRYQAGAGAEGVYSVVTYKDQPVRVFTLVNDQSMCNDSSQGSTNTIHYIQTAHSEQDIQQSLADLQRVLVQGAALVLVFALLGGWLISRGVLSTVQRITRTAQRISDSRDFTRRVPLAAKPGRDELATLVETFNRMLANLEEVYQRQQRFVADASHELRAPITSIRCNLDLLVKAPDLPTDETRAALDDARAEADRMGRLVNDLLTLARSDEAGQLTSIVDSTNSLARNNPKVNGYMNSRKQMRQIDLDSLLLEVFRHYRPVADDETMQGKDGPRQGPRLTLQHITPAKVSGDSDQLKQTLVALLDNALKYTPHEGNVALSLSTSKGYAIVTVSDTGPGIAPEDLPHIFERFYRADPARNRDRGGSGLGLAIASSIVQEHQGSIEVESTPGKGSIFTLKLPLTGT